MISCFNILRVSDPFPLLATFFLNFLLGLFFFLFLFSGYDIRKTGMEELKIFFPQILSISYSYDTRLCQK